MPWKLTSQLLFASLTVSAQLHPFRRTSSPTQDPWYRAWDHLGQHKRQTGLARRLRGKDLNDARHVYWNRNLDRQVHIQNREMPQTGLHLFGIMAPGALKFQKKSCGLFLQSNQPP
ncbi:hypothetical protein J3E68DRAFT_406413 [Trichoderma sp. SZMC 28012]